LGTYEENKNVAEVTSVDQLQEILDTERIYAGYAIGDLDPVNFSKTRWWGLYEGNKLSSICMLYEGLEPPILFVMGHNAGLRKILNQYQLPNKVYLTCKESHFQLLHEYYSRISPVFMWRMFLSKWRDKHELECVRLGENHLPDIKKLYKIGNGTGFSPDQVFNGVFYGIYAGDELVAMAGTHLVSVVRNIAAVGNVVTHPNYRGRGYATMTTNAVISTLINMRIKDIILNVAQGNSSAVSIYSKIGFEIHCPFIEGEAEVS